MDLRGKAHRDLGGEQLLLELLSRIVDLTIGPPLPLGDCVNMGIWSRRNRGIVGLALGKITFRGGQSNSRDDHPKLPQSAPSYTVQPKWILGKRPYL